MSIVVVGLLDEGEGDVHHVCEVVLSFFGGGDFTGEDIVGDGADDEGLIAGACGVHIEGGCFHLDGEYAHVYPFVVVRILGIEGI